MPWQPSPWQQEMCLWHAIMTAQTGCDHNHKHCNHLGKSNDHHCNGRKQSAMPRIMMLAAEAPAPTLVTTSALPLMAHHWDASPCSLPGPWKTTTLEVKDVWVLARMPISELIPPHYLIQPQHDYQTQSKKLTQIAVIDQKYHKKLTDNFLHVFQRVLTPG